MSVTKQFIRYVTQNIFGMLGISCYIIADTFFIAKAAGTDGITVLNLALPIYNLIFAIGSMIGVGSATRFAILRAQKEETAEYYFSNAICFVWMIGILFTLAGIFVPDKILTLMGADQTIAALGQGYTRIFLLFTPFFMMNYVIGAFVRNDDAPSLAMAGTLAGSLFNIVFDYIFMFPLDLGLEGAALATAASPVISILICSTHFLGKKNTIRFRMRVPSVRRLWQSCQLGVAAFVGEISSGVTTTVFNFLILGLVGNIGVAAYGVVANFALVATAIFNGVSQGAQPLASAYYGKGDMPSVKKILKLGASTAAVIGVLLVVCVYACTDSLVAVFNSEQSVKMAEYAYTGMRLYFIGFLFAGFNIVGAGFLSATGRARAAFVTSVMRGFVAIIACSLVLAAIIGLNGVWLSFPASEFITAILMAAVLYRGMRKEK
ncbi:MAG: MATE family efflux transporter [Roseburia sp.]|nr:MATE family efflux transporter [Roseburia sp.]